MTDEDLIAALEAAKAVLIQDGWCREVLHDLEGRHCAIGACDAIHQFAVSCTLDEYLESIGYTPIKHAMRCSSDFNDHVAQSLNEVLALFDDTIIWIKEGRP